MGRDKQGKDYEALVARLLKLNLRTASSDVRPVIRHRQKYVGKSGQSHEIDISFEVTHAAVTMLVFVECKCYSRRVGVDDLLEFSARLDDVEAHKGIVVSKSGFSSGALEIARSKRIALVRASIGKWVVAQNYLGGLPRWRYDWAHIDEASLVERDGQTILAFSPIDSQDVIQIGEESVRNEANELAIQLGIVAQTREEMIFAVEESGGFPLLVRIGVDDEEIVRTEREYHESIANFQAVIEADAEALRNLNSRDDSLDLVKPTSRNVILVSKTRVEEAAHLIVSCEFCDIVGATLRFDSILRRTTPDVPLDSDFFLETSAQCPRCRRKILEGSLIKPSNIC